MHLKRRYYFNVRLKYTLTQYNIIGDNCNRFINLKKKKIGIKTK